MLERWTATKVCLRAREELAARRRIVTCPGCTAAVR